MVIAGYLTVADELRELAAQAGWDVREPHDADGDVPFLCVDCGARPGRGAAPGRPAGDPLRRRVAARARSRRDGGRLPRAAAAARSPGSSR